MRTKPTQRRNSRQPGVMGAVSVSYRLIDKDSGSLRRAPLLLLLPSSDPVSKAMSRTQEKDFS